MNIGVTGSRLGLTGPQSDWLAGFLLVVGPTDLHHGDCEGVDAMAHDIAGAFGCRRVIHPPINPKSRAWCMGEEILPEKPYLERNKDIVNACSVLLVFPSGPERLRSGTWSTYRYAKKIGKHFYVIYPDGTFKQQDKEG